MPNSSLPPDAGTPMNLPATGQPSRRSWKSCLIFALPAIVLTVVALVLIQKLITPADDPNVSGPEVTDSGTGSQINSVPPTACTYGLTPEVINAAEHPLIPVLDLARRLQAGLDENVSDYTARLTSRVRTDDGTTHPERVAQVKVRHANGESGLSIYMIFLNPGEVAGQEAIWVGGKNQGKLIGHGTGLLNVKRMHLDPTGVLPMMGNRHPISKLGIRNFMVDLIEVGQRELEHDDVRVFLERGIDVDGVVCTRLTFTHPEKLDHCEFHIARIYIDDARNLPIAFESFLWPEKQGGEPPLLERYFYTDIKLNVGFTDEDFDPGNEEYNYPAW